MGIREPQMDYSPASVAAGSTARDGPHRVRREFQDWWTWRTKVATCVQVGPPRNLVLKPGRRPAAGAPAIKRAHSGNAPWESAGFRHVHRRINTGFFCRRLRLGNVAGQAPWKPAGSRHVHRRGPLRASPRSGRVAPVEGGIGGRNAAMERHVGTWATRAESHPTAHGHGRSARVA